VVPIAVGLVVAVALGAAAVVAFHLLDEDSTPAVVQKAGGKQDDGKAEDAEEPPEADPPLDTAELKKQIALRQEQIAKRHEQESRLVSQLAQKPASEDQHLELLSYRGPQASALAFAPDGQSLAFADEQFNREIYLLTLASGEVRKVGTHHGGAALAFTPDGTGLVSAAAFNEPALWDVATGQKRQSFVGHRDGITAALFTPDGKRLITAAGTIKHAEVRVWNVATGKLVRSFQDEAVRVTGLSLAMDGKTLAIGLSSRKVVFWNIHTGVRGQSLTAASDTVPVAFALDGRGFAYASGQEVKVVDADTRAERTLRGGGKGYQSVGLTPDGKIVLANCPTDYALANGDTRFWDTVSGELRAHWGGVINKQFSLFELDYPPALSPGGRMIACRVHNDRVKVWDLDEVLDPAWGRLFNGIDEWGRLSVRQGGVEISGYSDKVKDEHLAGLKSLKKIHKLTLLYSAHVTESALAALKELPGLRALQLTGMKHLTDAGLKHLRPCRQLEELVLDYCPKVTDAGLEHLSGMPQLRLLRLGSTGVTANGVERFRQNNPKVKVEL
jgi:WD40 repeat protein